MPNAIHTLCNVLESRMFDGYDVWCALSHHHDYTVVIVTRHTVVYIPVQ